MPRIIRFYQLGGPENLKLEDAPSRQPGPGEVRLRVQAVGLNRAEALFMRGQYFEQPHLPSTIGYEAAGVVEAVGPGVEQSWLGKRVATIPGFSMTQYGCSVKKRSFQLLPSRQTRPGLARFTLILPKQVFRVRHA
jgi:NADPH:quinone reductase-like Zn-dependent oxidoreductase